MGSRSADGEALGEWLAEAGEGAKGGSFAEAAAASASWSSTARPGSPRSRRCEAAGADNLAGKTLVDVANPLDFSAGHAAHALGLQRRQPRRADPGRLPGDPGGEGAEHGQQRGDGRPGPGPRRPRDLRLRRRRGGEGAGAGAARGVRLAAGIDRRPRRHSSRARATEMYLALWLRLYGALETADFNIAIAR